MIPDYQSKKRYKVTNEYDPDGMVMYFNMTLAVKSSRWVTDR